MCCNAGYRPHGRVILTPVDITVSGRGLVPEELVDNGATSPKMLVRRRQAAHAPQRDPRIDNPGDASASGPQG